MLLSNVWHIMQVNKCNSNAMAIICHIFECNALHYNCVMRKKCPLQITFHYFENVIKNNYITITITITPGLLYNILGRLPDLFNSHFEILTCRKIVRRSDSAGKCPPSFFIIIFSSFLHRDRKVYRIKSCCERKPILVVTIRIYSVSAR